MDRPEKGFGGKETVGRSCECSILNSFEPKKGFVAKRGPASIKSTFFTQSSKSGNSVSFTVLFRTPIPIRFVIYSLIYSLICPL